MRINEVDKKITQVELNALEKALDRVFVQVGIDVEFTRHFLDRVNDERNIRQITITELAYLFKKEFLKYGKPIAQLGPDAEAVMKDLSSDINIPFALDWNKDTGMLELIAKTVMRKKNFHTPDKEFAVEYHLSKKQNTQIAESIKKLVEQAMPKLNAGGVMGTGLDPQQFQQRYGVSPRQAQARIGNVTRLRPGFQSPRTANAITNYMLQNPNTMQAANDNTRPSGNKVPNIFKGLIGRSLGVLGLLIMPTPAGEGSDLPDNGLLSIANDLHRWMLYNDPQALIDMHDAEWNALTPQEQEQNSQWNPANDPTYQGAKDAVTILDRADDLRQRRFDDLVSSISNPGPEVATTSPAQSDPNNTSTDTDINTSTQTDTAPLPHRRPDALAMPDVDTAPDFWPDDVPFEPFNPFDPSAATANDKQFADVEVPQSVRDEYAEVLATRNAIRVMQFLDGLPQDQAGKLRYDGVADVKTAPEVDPVAPAPLEVPQPDTAPEVAPTADPEVNLPKQPAQPDAPASPDIAPATPPSPAPKVDPVSPAPLEVPQPDTAPEVTPTADPEVDLPKQPDPLADPSDPEKAPVAPPSPSPRVDPTAPVQPTQPEPLKAPDMEPLTGPELPGVVTIPGTIAPPMPGAAPVPQPSLANRPPKPPKGNNNQRRMRRGGSSSDSDYDNPLRKWVNKHTPPTFESEILESGSAPGVGPIHRDEIEATLAPISKFVGIDLSKQALGSVGKKQFSGDIDVAINIPPEEWNSFQEKLESSPLFSHVEKTSVYITKIKIQNYDPDRTFVDPRTGEDKGVPPGRTGYAQLDFMPGDPGWLKTYYHSPSETESKYKGVFRNIMISTIAAVYKRTDSEQKLSDGRSLETERYMWSPSEGLVRVVRTPVMNKKGTAYTKKNKNTKTGGPWRTADDIATELGLGDASVLNSFESLLAAVEKNYDKSLVAQIKQGFTNNKVVQDIGIPSELTDK